MNKFILSVCVVVVSLSAAFGSRYAGAVKKDARQTAVLEGKVHRWTGEGCVLVVGEDRKYDTLRVAADGSFRYELATAVPVEKGLYLEYLGDNRVMIPCYLTPGGTTTVNVSAEQEGKRLKSVPVFTGENRRECEYLGKTKDFWCGFQAEYLNKEGQLITFREYKQQLSDYQQGLRKILKSTRPDFAKEKGAAVDRLTQEVLFPYAWGAKYKGGNAADDPDFRAYSETIDLNDPDNMGITDQWLRFYMEQHPDTAFSNHTIRYFSMLREKISNEKVRNELADSKMDGYFGMGGDSAMPEIFAAYKQTSTNQQAIDELQPLYDRLSKLIPGVEASDFEMQTVDGKTVRFREVIGQGKVTYIDFWATWCGPCCAEIPYVEKLVEKFGTNPDIEFISISLDANLEKWHKKLEQDRPTWRQFVIPDNFNSTFVKEYHISGIPRFMMFDKEGKIIHINAPRPSSPEIESYLQKYIR